MKPLYIIGTILGSAALCSLAIGSTPVSPVTGTVTGRIVFEGEKPTMKPVTISDEQSKGCCPEGVSMDTTDRKLLIGDKNGIANVVISVEIDGQAAKLPEKPIEIDQTKCRFEPHVAVVPVGGKVAYLNSDTVSHNIHTYANKNEGLNKTVSGGGTEEQTFEKAETIKVTCDIHPWMTSWIYVTDASVWTVSGADGSFSLAGLPPGDYKVEIWHEELGKSKESVTVAADGSSEPLEVMLGADKKKKKRR